jgi:hypothetical protein
MTLPLSPIEIIVFFFATLLAVRLMATRLPASIASYAVMAVMLALWYLGPFLCGRDWYGLGFPWGLCIGGFGYLAYRRKMEPLDGAQVADLRSQRLQVWLVLMMVALIALVLMLATGH